MLLRWSRVKCLVLILILIWILCNDVFGLHMSSCCLLFVNGLDALNILCRCLGYL
ncbi:hypothetical protein BDV34DRAFT_206588 [Aspergillus parasiticus]|uniref:Uncharacterized protein n=1 Tax=Aspergillus parasiticus TaxID=5067 RepID=A0A5N6D3N9_ASPPA|nr:hypothetical protein BDV34DRAFT_206588 [Aspergillus parasiticus]